MGKDSVVNMFVNREEYLEQLKTLVNIESGSYNAAGINRVADQLEAWYRDLGWHVQRHHLEGQILQQTGHALLVAVPVGIGQLVVGLRPAPLGQEADAPGKKVVIRSAHDLLQQPMGVHCEHIGGNLRAVPVAGDGDIAALVHLGGHGQRAGGEFNIDVAHRHGFGHAGDGDIGIGGQGIAAHPGTERGVGRKEHGQNCHDQNGNLDSQREFFPAGGGRSSLMHGEGSFLEHVGCGREHQHLHYRGCT